MLYQGEISDSAGHPITGATLSFVTDAGQRLTGIPVINGHWLLDSSFDGALLEGGINAVFSAPGYFDYKISSITMPPTFNVTLTKKTDKLPLIIAGAGLGAALLYFAGKKGKLSGPGKGLPAWVLPTAILGGGAFILYNLFGKPDPRILQGNTLPQAAAAELLSEIAAGRGPTLSASEAEALAADIVQAANDCGTDENAIYSAFANLNNRADLLLLIKTYGVKVYKACFDGDYFKDTPRNLAETITSEFGPAERATLNNILTQEGINYAF